MLTRRSLFARLAGALAAVPLVGKVVQKRVPVAELLSVGKPILPPMEFYPSDFRCPLGFRPVVEKTRSELEATYPPAVREYLDAFHRNSQKISDEMDRLFHEG